MTQSTFLLEGEGRTHSTARVTAALRAQWRDARRMKGQVQKVLEGVGFQFVEWVVLESLDELCTERGEPVTQSAVAERAGVSKTVASYWMAALAEDCLVDFGLGEDARAHQLVVEELGAEVLALVRERLGEAGLVEQAEGGGPLATRG